MNLDLHRFSYTANGTFGEIYMNGEHLCFTCELPWQDNKTGISCIPAGTYECQPHDGVKFKRVWELENVPNRSAILIHNGNTVDDTDGCILVGDALGKLYGRPAVMNSQEMLGHLREVLPDTFTLTIK